MDISKELLVLLAAMESEGMERAVCVSACVCTGDLCCDSDLSGLSSPAMIREEWLQDCCKI